MIYIINGINYILKYIKNIMQFLINNTSKYYCFYCIFDQINVALVRIRDLFKNIYIYLIDPKLLNGVYLEKKSG